MEKTLIKDKKSTIFSSLDLSQRTDDFYQNFAKDSVENDIIKKQKKITRLQKQQTLKKPKMSSRRRNLKLQTSFRMSNMSKFFNLKDRYL